MKNSQTRKEKTEEVSARTSQYPAKQQSPLHISEQELSDSVHIVPIGEKKKIVKKKLII